MLFDPPVLFCDCHCVDLNMGRCGKKMTDLGTCVQVDKHKIDFMGYSIRTDKYRYTEWVSRTALLLNGLRKNKYVMSIKSASFINKIVKGTITSGCSNVLSFTITITCMEC